MSNELQGKKIAILAADGVEKVELEQPRAALQDAGAQVEVLSLKTGEIQARNHDLEPAGSFAVDRAVSDASVDEFDGLVSARRHGESRTSYVWTNPPSRSCVTSSTPESPLPRYVMVRGRWWRPVWRRAGR